MCEWFAREFFICGMYEVGSYILMFTNTPMTSGKCAGGATGGKKLQSSSSFATFGPRFVPFSGKSHKNRVRHSEGLSSPRGIRPPHLLDGRCSIIILYLVRK